MNIIYVALLFGLLVYLFIRKLRVNAQRKKATYSLYSVKDDLVCLVAEGKINENSRIFKYYYSRINTILKLAPNVGIDHAVESFLNVSSQSQAEAQRRLKFAKKTADEMVKLVEKEDPVVSDVIANYYSATRDMMLSHSSLLRLLYLIVTKNSWLSKLSQSVPIRFQTAIQTVDFANKEANIFKQHCNIPS